MRAAAAPASARDGSPTRPPYIAGDWKDLAIKHVVESQQFSKASLDLIFDETERMEAVRPGTLAAKCLEGFIMASVFFEPSTRTRFSFESAMARLGGTVISSESAGTFSSAAKGEDLGGE